MSWSIGFDRKWKRDIGYGVPAHCDYPGCRRVIDRGLSYVCGGEPKGGEHGCGLYFCEKHLGFTVNDAHTEIDKHQRCDRCIDGGKPFDPKPDHKSWTQFKMKDPSWAEWRKEHGIPEPRCRIRVPRETTDVSRGKRALTCE